MNPFFYAFISLLVSGCIIYKKPTAPKVAIIESISDINKLPFSSNDAKCILLEYKKDNGLAPSAFSYYFFFPEEHIYMHYRKINSPYIPELGYYDFEPKAADGNSYLYLETATKAINNIRVENKYIKKSLDSIYIHFKLSTIESITVNQEYPIEVFNFLENDKLKPIDNFSVTTLVNRSDSTALIIALKKDKINKLSFFLYFNFYCAIEIDEQHNYYEITGSSCAIHRKLVSPTFWGANKKYKRQVKPLTGNSYEFSRIPNEDSVDSYKEIYTWQDASSLYNYEKEPLYMLPTFIKILECSGTYPRK